jgi:predicted permease
MYSVFCNVLPIVLIAIIGSFIRKKWLISDEFWRGLEKLSFYLLFPAVLFGSVYRLELASSEFFRLVSALIISNLIVSALVVYYQTKENYDKAQFTSLFQGTTRYNNYIFFALMCHRHEDQYSHRHCQLRNLEKPFQKRCPRFDLVVQVCFHTKVLHRRHSCRKYML